jgi:hypothetical protein
MFASYSALASLLMLTSSANLVNAKMTPFLFAAIAAEDDMVPFTYDITFKFTDPGANEITDSSKTIIEGCIASSFNEVHDPKVIQLYDATITKLDIKPMASHFLYGAKEEARLSSEGEGNYSVGGGGVVVGGTCRRCLGMLRSPFFVEWQNALDACLVTSGAAGLDGVAGIKLSIPQLFETPLGNAQDDMVPFTYDIAFKFTDPNANEITDSSKTIIEGCIVSSFNEAHDPKVVQLYDVNISKLDIKPMAMTLLRGSSTSTGNYSIGGGGTAIGGSCTGCESMLGSPYFVEWQNALDMCIATSGAGLAGVADVEVTINSGESVSEQ